MKIETIHVKAEAMSKNIKTFYICIIFQCNSILEVEIFKQYCSCAYDRVFMLVTMFDDLNIVLT